MPGFSVGSTVRWLANVGSKLALSYRVGPVALLLVSIVFSFWPASAPRDSDVHASRLSWREPFSYEAKVYAALSPSTFPNASSFFDSAQLLWHIRPQSIENRYPLLRHKAVVDIPLRLRKGSNQDLKLKLFMYIQEAGQFKPHPNVTDPRLVSLAIPIMLWKGKHQPSLLGKDTPTTRGKEHTPELQYVSGASWAIVLEDNGYSWDNVLDRVTHAFSRSRGGFYKPPLLRNDFTVSRPKIKSLATLKDKSPEADAHPLTIDIELELSGIRAGWTFARDCLDIYTRPSSKTIYTQETMPAPWDPSKTVTFESAHEIPDDGPIPLDLVRRLSVPLMFVFILCSAFERASFPLWIQIFLYLYSTPASKWKGVSRATVATIFIGSIVTSLQMAEEYGDYKFGLFLGLLPVTYIGASMDGMTFAPLVALSRLFRLRAQHKPSSRAADQYFAQEKIPVPVDMGVLGSIAPEAVLPESASMSHSERLDPIVAIRRSVDEVAMYWLNLLSIPVVVAAVIFYTLLHFKFDLPLLEFAKEQSINVPRVIKFVAWLPQIIVNYKAKSGSLVPMVIVLYSLASAVAATIVYHLSGHRMPGVITAYSFPVYLSYIVLILQWVMYRKAKQD